MDKSKAYHNGQHPSTASVWDAEFTGLTKREAFAMAAMQGELASQTNRHHSDNVYSSDKRMNDRKLMAKRCVTFADALLAELEK